MTVLKQLFWLTVNELVLFGREPVAMFFSLVFPVGFLVLTMEVFTPAGAPKDIIINHVAPSLMVLNMASTAIYGVPGTIATYRQSKFLKRLKCSPAKTIAILGSLAASSLAVTLFSLGFLIVVAMWLYGARIDGSFIGLWGAFNLAFWSLAASFLFISSVTRSERVSSTIAQVIFFPMTFFSGVFVPLERLPDWIERYVSPVIPVTHAVELMQGAWLGTPLDKLTVPIGALFVFLILGLAVATYTFKWE